MERVVSFFAFPLNLIFAVVWVIAALYLLRFRRRSAFVRFMLSPGASISSIVLFLGACLWMGFSGDRGFARTAFFVAVLFYLQSVLLFVILRGWRDKVSGAVRWRFILNHAGLLVALSSAFWGAPDSEELRMRLAPGQSAAEAFRTDGSRAWLRHEVALLSLSAEKDENGVPSEYGARIRVGDKFADVSVNHPYSDGIGENIYLASVSQDTCVLQIVHEPWKYAALAGIIMMLAGAVSLFLKGPSK